MKKLLTGLFRASRKRLMTTDNDMGMFRQKLDELVDQKDNLTDEDVETRVEELKKITEDLPDDDGKAKLSRFLEDFKSVKEQDAAVAKEAAKAVADQFEKLDAAAMQDVPAVEPESAEAPVDEPLVEGAAPEAEPEDGDPATEEELEETETVAEETMAPAEEDTTDADPNPEYSMEEIYQFIKKRMAEDEAAEAETDIEDEEVVEEENPEEEIQDGCEQEEVEEKEVVTDHAPHISVTMNNNAAGGNLRSLFDMAKRGK